MDVICSNIGCVPKEFIFGYYEKVKNQIENGSSEESTTYDLIENPSFCKECKINDELYDMLVQGLDPSNQKISIACAKALAANDISIVKDTLGYIKVYRLLKFKPLEFIENIDVEIAERIERGKNSHQKTRINSKLATDSLLPGIKASETEFARKVERDEKERNAEGIEKNS